VPVNALAHRKRLSEPDVELSRHRTLTSFGARPGSQLIQQGCDDSAVDDVLPAAVAFGNGVVQFDALCGLPDIEVEPVRVILAAREADAGVFQHLGFKAATGYSSTVVPAGGVNLNSLPGSFGFHFWLRRRNVYLLPQGSEQEKPVMRLAVESS